ncbi:MAG: SDR family NAD(P)-dependent oxidoreductase [Halothece sp.]
MTNDIAIIGMTGRFPDASNIDQFWENLKQGKEGIAPLSDQQLQQGGIPPHVYQQPNYVKASPILKDDIAEFDAEFFGYSPREAENSDPQQRIFLEVAWEALEIAGCNPETASERIGVFGGVGRNTYLLFNLHHQLNQLDSIGAFQTLIGNDKDFLATRISYLLNLTGPSVTVQTACSTSLVAVHSAVSSLLSGESDLALAGGVSLKVPHLAGYHYQEGGIYSPDGHCRSFDAQAQGTVGGSGAGMVVLKRLEDAQADGNTIYAVIKGSAVNNDGSAKVGYTAPSVTGQASAIAEALFVADIDPATIQYIEAHGTATPLGDPIEVQALTQAFQTGTQETGYCALGSVKSNVGHLDAAAGVTGLIKTVLSLHHQAIPPSLHFQQPNPEIDFDNSPFFVNTALTPWQPGETPRRAGVSSFGIGGTNAHVVLEEAPTPVPSSKSRSRQLLLLSAKSETALTTARENLADYLTNYPDVKLADVAYTLNTSRKAFPHRQMLVCSDVASAVTQLQETTSQSCPDQSPAVTFLFPGQGAQFVNMARELYQTESVFREQLDAGAEQLQSLLNLDLRQLLYPPEGEEATANQQLTQTAIAQPALFILEYSLARLWQSWGIQPQAMIGHSIGEYVAASLAGVISFPDALWLVVQRAQLMQSLPAGQMLSITASPSEIEPWLGDDLALAVINAPQLCVVSGEESAITQLQSQLDTKGINHRLLNTSHAFHSPMMNPILDQFRSQVANVRLNPPKIPFISNLTGTWMTSDQATNPEYWTKQLRHTVQFAAGISELLQQERFFLEVGPGTTLSTLVKQQATTPTLSHSLPHPKAQTSDQGQMLQALGELWLNGISPDWSEFYREENRQLLPLPTYPFQRQRYWIDPPTSSGSEISAESELRKNGNLSEWFYVPSWKRELLPPQSHSPATASWLIFLDAAGLGETMAHRLREQGNQVVTVQAGTAFTQRGEQAYDINPNTREDYETLFRTLADQNQFPQKLLHFWNVAPNAQQAESCFHQLLFLAQAIGKQEIAETLPLTVIASEQFDVTGADPLSPEKATVKGICKVISQEYPQLPCRVIDLDATAFDGQRESLSNLLLNEINSDTADTAIAYRNGYRWRQTFDPISLTEPTTSLIQEGGVYFLTGGLGGIGLALADAIAQTPRTKLVLISRSGLPDRAEWQEWLTGEEGDDAVADKIRRVQALEEQGAEVLVLAADVSDRASMETAVQEAQTRFGTINGVIHTAGIPGGGIIQLKSPEQAETVLSSKLQGTRILDELFADKPLDFMILNSSLSSVMGGVGQADYCAANAFLDSFAYYRTHRKGQLTLAINWDTWQEVGMAVNTAIPEQLQKRRDQGLEMGISPSEGQEAFRRLQGVASPQVIVCTKDLPTVIQRRVAPQSLEELATPTSQDEESQPSATYPRPDLDVSYVAPRNETETIIAETWQRFLGIEPVGIHDDFFELGGHSLLATEIISALRDRFQQELPLNRLFETPTVAGLASMIAADNADDPQTIPSTQGEETEDLLSELNELSAHEVDTLLNQVLTNHEHD